MFAKIVGVVALMFFAVIAAGFVFGFNTKTFRAELPNGVNFHNIFLRRWDDNVVMRSASGKIVVPADVIRIKYSSTHVFVAQRKKGPHHARYFFVYDVAADKLTPCIRALTRTISTEICDTALLNTGIIGRDIREPDTIGGWRDWHYLTLQSAGFRRYWWEHGSAGGFWRSLVEGFGGTIIE